MSVFHYIKHKPKFVGITGLPLRHDGQSFRLQGIYNEPPVSERSVRFGVSINTLTVGPAETKVMLESGINPVAEVPGVDGRRRPMIALRSAPWKAGGESTPWHDVFDLDHGHVRYFGDHKVSSDYPLGQRRGNAALLAAWPAHQGTDHSARLVAVPFMLFRLATVNGQVKAPFSLMTRPIRRTAMKAPG